MGLVKDMIQWWDLMDKKRKLVTSYKRECLAYLSNYYFPTMPLLRVNIWKFVPYQKTVNSNF
jgi:hypothetical protein